MPQPPLSSPAAPSPAIPDTWAAVGRNPYGEAVEENAQGIRRVSTEHGWVEERQLPKWRSCRASTPEEARQAMQSLADPWVSAGFEHNLKRAYLVYRLAQGQPVSRVPAHWGTDQDPGWKPFNQGVLTARGNRVLRAWLRRRPQAPNVPKWLMALPANSPTSFRALQWGLAHRLEAWAADHPGARFVEMGLLDAADAATARLNAHQRLAYAATPAAPWAPPSEVLRGWPAVPGKAIGAFGKKPAAAWSAAQVPVVWATPAACKMHGLEGLDHWWSALATQPSGAVVFEKPLPQAAAFLQQLKAAGRRPGRARVEGLGEVWSWGLGMDAQDLKFTPEQWAVAQEPPVTEDTPLSGDERVPYRALSQSSEPEGMAGRALESNMHAALLDLQRARGNQSVDDWVAEGLGVDPATLSERLSAEQIDAIALARQSLEQGTGFLLSDETGFGKGRALASLALTGLKQGRPVVFVTENPFLFSDFFRDLLAVDVETASKLRPTLLHQKATVLDPQGRKVVQAIKGTKFQEMLKVREWGEREDQIIFTTYAQLSHSVGKGKDNQKLGWLRDRLGPMGWLLMDEAHNAAGESSVGERIDKLASNCSGVVYASATFAKHEANLDRYKTVLALPAAAQRLLRLALAGDDGLLREALTQQMARSGRMVRREHPPVPPPQPFWIEMTPERQAAVKAFGATWRGLFDATAAYGQLSGVRESIWLHLGAALSRSVREFGLQLKADALVDVIQEKISENKKVVVVVDTTMEAALREALTPDQEDMLDEEEEAWEDDGAVGGEKAPPPQMVREGDGAPPLWKDRLRAILEAVCPRSAWESNASKAARVAQNIFQATEAALESLPDWDLAPLDRVRRNLATHDIDSSELSGRQTRLMILEKGWKVINRNDPDRNEVVRAFNQGELDVLFVTRAGCAGISLHAGQKFADQRVRCLMEWDIAANPVNRVQFWGRVRRKDQVIEPEFLGLVMDTPEDRRIIEREDRKRRRLASHLGTSVAESVGWLSELGEAIVEEWAEERSIAGFRIGVNRPMPDNPIGRVDRALVRSLVLPDAEREGLLSRLERGVQLGAQAFGLARNDQAHRSSRVIRRTWWWGDPAASVADPAQALAALRLDLVERVWRPEPGASAQTISEHVRREAPLQPKGSEVLAQWRRAWASETQTNARLAPYRERLGKWLMAVLPGLDVGQAFTFTHPSTARATRAVMLGWSVPDGRAIQGGASPWALSQVSISAWAVGDSTPIELPLMFLHRDAGFKLLNRAASPAWYQAPPVPLRALAVEGHPVQAAAWGRRWGVGRSALVRDTDEGSQLVWLLPPHVTWEKALELPRDLVDVEHAIAFWRAYPSEPLAASLPLTQRITATPVSGGLMLAFGTETVEAAKQTWLNPNLQRRLRLNAHGAPAGWLHTKLEWKNVPRVLHSLAAVGIGWRMPSKYLDWYMRTSPERTRAKSG